MNKSADAFRTISEVADWLGVQTHVLRFWESKFTQVKPVKRAGGRRYYRPADMLLLGGIRRLLHDDGLTIKGVQKILREEGMAHVADLSHPLDEETEAQLDGDLVSRSEDEAVSPPRSGTTDPKRAAFVSPTEISPTEQPAEPPTEFAFEAAPDDAPETTPEPVTEPEYSAGPEQVSEDVPEPDEVSEEPVAPPSPEFAPVETDTPPAPVEASAPPAPVEETVLPEPVEARGSLVTDWQAEPVEATPPPGFDTDRTAPEPDSSEPHEEPSEPWPPSKVDEEPKPVHRLVDPMPPATDADNEQPEPEPISAESASWQRDSDSHSADDSSMSPLPSFLSEPLASPPEPAQPRARVVDVPDDPDPDSIAVSPSPLSKVGSIKRLTPAQISAMRPLVAQLRALRDQMSAARRDPR